MSSVKYLGEQCFKVTMPGIQFKVKLHTSVLFASKIKTQKGIYAVNDFINILDEHYLSDLALLEKKIIGVDFRYHYIEDGRTY
ncbi:MAG: hypothetical protein ACFFCX_17625, partial [Candidatus Sifarchaeia archaeon]